MAPLEITSDIAILIFFLSIIQSMLGVGILVIGTPFLLLLGYNYPEFLEVLLPASIITSIITIILQKKKFKEIFDKDLLKNFFLLCLPAVIFGLIILPKITEFLNIKILVGSVILVTIIVKNFNKITIKSSNLLLRKFFIFFTGFFHGITNSGGTLISIFFSTINKDFRLESRYQISFFYFLLAFFQYITFKILYNFKGISLQTISIILIICVFGAMVGNQTIKRFKNNILIFFVDFLALISAISLIINS